MIEIVINSENKEYKQLSIGSHYRLKEIVIHIFFIGPVLR